jgi:hypothetical protein
LISFVFFSPERLIRGFADQIREEQRVLDYCVGGFISSGECAHMGITVAVKVDHLPTAFNAPVPSPASDKLRTILVPNVDYHGTVRATLNAFIRQNLFIPERLQLLSAPLFTKLSEKDSVEDIYTRYACQVQQEGCCSILFVHLGCSMHHQAGFFF